MTDLFNIENKKIIITGGSGGLGFDITKELLKSGAEVLIIDISKNFVPLLATVHKNLYTPQYPEIKNSFIPAYLPK